MTNDLLSTSLQPYARLAQANAELLTRFSSSSEVVREATTLTTQMAQQMGTTLLKLMQGHAYAELSQGLMKNYMTFLGELGQGTLAAMTEGQGAAWQQAQSVTDQTISSVRAAGRAVKQ